MLYPEFANGSVGPAFHMREASAPVIASTRVFVQHDGAMLDAEGRQVIADFILAPLGVDVVGTGGRESRRTRRPLACLRAASCGSHPLCRRLSNGLPVRGGEA